VEATKKFWMVVGGTPTKIDGTDVMKFPGVLIFVKAGSPPPDGNKGTAVDHPGMTMRGGEALLNKIKAAGYKVEPIGAAEYGPESGYITSPDGLRIEMQGTDNSLSKRPLLGFTGPLNDLPTVADHLHYFLPGTAAPEAQAWYFKMFGGNQLKENNRGNTPAVDLPGIRLRFGGTREAMVTPTKGRAMDYVGFEVKDLKAFCKKLETSGIKLDEPYSKSRHKGFASAELTDPWGLSIELTEGLSKY
jgi:catechol 2,3-dioxygenase-like lactoylglutathione lyase family enzyme